MSYTQTIFLNKLKPYVITDMKNSGILASLTAAQALIESRYGNSALAVQCNNLFGIKGTYNGQSKKFKTTEYYNNVRTEVMADFRKYPSWQESIADHSDLFNRLARYKNLRGCTDYARACKYVKDDGYATAPDYTQTLMNTINTYKLYLWDGEVTGKIVPMKPAPSLPVLRKGSKGDYVYHWQLYLNLNGFFCGNADSKFGPNMEIAVKEFQASKGLMTDGIIGPKTWASIGLTA